MTYIFSFIIVLGVLIFIHELGHFLIARAHNVGVEKFSIGFGPKIFSKKAGITEYRISAIPLGGYVKLVGEAHDSIVKPSQEAISFSNKSAFKRAQIIGAGPVFNILLALVIFFVFYTIAGIPDIAPIVKNIEKNSPAYNAGIKTDDTILYIKDSKVESWYDIQEAVSQSKGSPLYLTAKRDGTNINLEVVPALKIGTDIFGDALEYYYIGMSGIPILRPIVGEVIKGFPADLAGIKKGDLITAIDDIQVASWHQMRKAIQNSGGKKLAIDIKRDDQTLKLTLFPRQREDKDNIEARASDGYVIGISSQEPVIPDQLKVTKRFGPVKSFALSIKQCWLIAKLTVIGAVKTIAGAISPDNIGGPIMIAKMAGDRVKEGAGSLIQFIAFLSISLAILNILPIPVLDGGHLMFLLIEIITRKPVNIKIKEKANQAGMIILITLMLFVCYNDIMRFF